MRRSVVSENKTKEKQGSRDIRSFIWGSFSIYKKVKESHVFVTVVFLKLLPFGDFPKACTYLLFHKVKRTVGPSVERFKKRARWRNIPRSAAPTREEQKEVILNYVFFEYSAHHHHKSESPSKV